MTGENYNGGATAIVGHLIAKGTGMPVDEYARQKLFEPLGFESFEWVKGRDDVPSVASGLRLNIHDLAKIGRLVLGDGVWQGKQVVPADWLKVSFTPHANLHSGLRYGLFWWLSPDGLPPNWVAGFGNGGQRLTVSPVGELVVVVFAGNYNAPDAVGSAGQDHNRNRGAGTAIEVTSVLFTERTRMQSQWSDDAAGDTVAHYRHQGVTEDLALRVYTTRLLGRDPLLVLHGGGNTSVKTRARDILGDEHDVLCVKGSGWDMGAIEPAGLPAVKLAPLQKARALDGMSDEDMVNFQRLNLLDSASPNPSVETLLHAFLPHKFVDHTHSTAVLSLIDQPDGEARARALYGDRMGIVPYVMPGFDLAKRAAEIYAEEPDVNGLVLHKHGVFTFGDTARESYEFMIGMVTLAEAQLPSGRNLWPVPGVLPDDLAPVGDIAPIIRGACAEPAGTPDAEPRRLIMTFRSDKTILAYVNGADLADYSQRGVATPDHIIRTKNVPLLLPAPIAGNLGGFAQATHDAVTRFSEDYRTYFDTHNPRSPTPKTRLDPMPRVVLVPGVGMFGLGKSAKDAGIAADIAENAIRVTSDAEALGIFESLPENELFEMEHWSLEQAKLGKGAEPPLARHVAVVTGGAGTIGSATAAALKAQGADVVVLDLDGDAATEIASNLNGLGLACDVTDRQSVERAFGQVCEAFGGVDIVVSNAGAAWQGKIGEVSDDVLRQSFELNFFAHQNVAQAAVRVMRAQGTGGTLLFNVSKQAVNPGLDFGPYGLPKAALMFLVRQYALDHAADGIRACGVNADRIRSGLLTAAMIAERASARGVSEDDYLGGNLLGREVTADDVARAFVSLALARKTTGHIETVDGGQHRCRTEVKRSAANSFVTVCRFPHRACRRPRAGNPWHSGRGSGIRHAAPVPTGPAPPQGRA